MLKIIAKLLGVLFLLGVVFPLVVLLIYSIWSQILWFCDGDTIWYSISEEKTEIGVCTMKYVVKMDYCTMAFTSGTCSLQALSNCLAGDTDLHWVQIYNSEKSPYHSPLGLLFQAVLPGAADGVWFSFSCKIPRFPPVLWFFLTAKISRITCKSDSPVWCPYVCNEGKKIFRLDIFARRIIMKIERDAAVSAVSPQRSK